MKPAGWTPLTGKWLRRGFGLFLIAGGTLAFFEFPVGVAVFVGDVLVPFIPLAMMMVAIGLVLCLVF